VGILLGWIVQKRWLTLGAVLLCVVGLIAIPHLPAPLTAVWVALPGILFAAITYEGAGALLGNALYVRARLFYALCEGAAALVLGLGITFADSNPQLLVGAFVVSVALFVAGLLPLAVKYRRLVRRNPDASVWRTH
jgi:hypothetical protein